MIKQRKRNPSIKKLPRKRKRKNPDYDIIEILESLEPHEENIPFESISEGDYGETYAFEIYSRKILPDSTVLKPGKYLIKRFFNFDGHISNEEIKYLEKLSNYGLIPKIYFANKYFVIMKYIKSTTLKECLDNDSLSRLQISKIVERLYFLIDKWHKLGFVHGDLQNFKNILITKNKVYLIDPSINYIDKRKDISDIEYIEYRLNNPYEEYDTD